MKWFNTLIFVALICFATGKKLPSEFTTCSRSDPKVEECFVKAFKTAIPYAKDGIPDLGIVPIEPVTYGSISFEGNPKSAISISQKLKDVKIFNLVNSNFTKSEIKFGDKDVNIILYSTNEKVRFQADYEINGKILLLPISGEGKTTADFYDVEIIVAASLNIYEKKGKSYLKVDKVTLKVEPKRIEFNFDNLFNGNKELGDQMNKLLNENDKEIYAEFRYGYEEAIAALIKSIYDNVFDRIPYDELFPL